MSRARSIDIDLDSADYHLYKLLFIETLSIDVQWALADALWKTMDSKVAN